MRFLPVLLLLPSLAAAQDLAAAVDSVVSAQVAADNFSGVVAVARMGRLVYQRAAGVADRDANAPMTMDTKLQIASTTKLFTNIAIRQLEQAGKLSLSDTVGKFLPDYPNAVVRSRVTVEQLLRHRSGIGSFWNDRWMATRASVRTVQDYLRLFQADSLLFEPGTSEAYSNGGYVVLRAIIEKLSGMSYHEYLRERVFKPAGMTSTVPYDRSTRVANAATGYTRQPMMQRVSAGPRTSNADMQPGMSGPAGDHYSTVGDFMRLAAALASGKLLDSAHARALLGGRYGRGMDFRANGGGPGVNAEFSMYPNGDVMVVLSNYDPPAATTIAQFIRGRLEPPAGAASTSAGGETIGTSPTDSRTLRILDSLWARAYAQQDTALALQVYAPTLVFTSSDGRVKTRAQEMADVRPSAGFTMNYFRTTPSDVRIASDTATISGTAEWSFTTGGSTRQIRRSYILTATRGGAIGWNVIGVRMGSAVPPASRVEVPLTKIGPFYYAEVRLNGEPFRFTVETGAPFAAISNRAAARLGLPVDTTRATPGAVVMRPGMPTVNARIDSLSIGAATLRGVDVRVTSMFDAMEFDGILSLQLLRNFLWTLDLSRSRLVLEQASLPEPNGRDVLAITGADAGGRVGIPLDLDGTRLNAVLDTRYADWIMTNDSLLASTRLASPVRTVGTARGPSLGNFEMRGARLAGSVRTGRYIMPNAPVVFRTRGGTIVGAAFLEQFVVTVDQPNGRIRLTRADSIVSVPQLAWERPDAATAAGQPPSSAPARTFGFRIAARPDGRLFVVLLDSTSTAARMGIRENDEVAEVDGVPAAQMRPEIFRAALARGTPVKFVVLRDGKRTEFVVPSFAVR